MGYSLLNNDKDRTYSASKPLTEQSATEATPSTSDAPTSAKTEKRDAFHSSNEKQYRVAKELLRHSDDSTSTLKSQDKNSDSVQSTQVNPIIPTAFETGLLWASSLLTVRRQFVIGEGTIRIICVCCLL